MHQETFKPYIKYLIKVENRANQRSRKRTRCKPPRTIFTPQLPLTTAALHTASTARPSTLNHRSTSPPCTRAAPVCRSQGVLLGGGVTTATIKNQKRGTKIELGERKILIVKVKLGRRGAHGRRCDHQTSDCQSFFSSGGHMLPD